MKMKDIQSNAKPNSNTNVKMSYMTTSLLTSLGKTVFVVIEQLSHDLNFITGKELFAVCSVECEYAMISSFCTIDNL